MSQIRIVNGVAHLDEVRNMIGEYLRFLGRDLAFQDVQSELEDPTKKYTAPEGELLVALVDSKVAGMVAYHRLSDETCEMKRLFVRSEARSLGLGRMLVQEIVSRAKRAGYKEMVLDTIEPLKAAIHVYRTEGFIECEPYYFNPMDDVLYFKKEL